ncbi:MAG: glutamate-5-semialdehyde dehydrogenase, partial [Planctomycetes bacterium RIFCSPHIGHO2_02_FULL_52_58]
MKIEEYVNKLAVGAKEASRSLSHASTTVKDAFLSHLAQSLIESRDALKGDNQKDIDAAKTAGLSKAIIDRLLLNDSGIQAMAEGLKTVISLKDPVGEVMEGWRRPNGILIEKVRVPLGVIVIIYESRPDATVEAASLCLKAGNAVILRGGKEAINSNLALYALIKGSLKKAGLDERSIQLVETTDRTAVDYLLKAEGLVDVIIPRGGEGLIRSVAEKSRIPVIKHYKGVCHVYVDEYADLEKAERICYNAKVQRPATCNAMETMLVHEKVAGSFLPRIGKKLQGARVEIRGCPVTRKHLTWAKEATEEDWYA